MKAFHHVTFSKIWINIWLSCLILYLPTTLNTVNSLFQKCIKLVIFCVYKTIPLYIFFTIFSHLLFFIIFGFKCFVFSELFHVWQWNTTWMPSYFSIGTGVHKYLRLGSLFLRKYVGFHITKKNFRHWTDKPTWFCCL